MIASLSHCHLLIKVFQINVRMGFLCETFIIARIKHALILCHINTKFTIDNRFEEKKNIYSKHKRIDGSTFIR